LHGQGGTGKTYKIRQYQDDHPGEQILMTATTGVAAINIGPGCITINSAFKYFDDASLRDAITRRHAILSRELANCDVIVIDEMSMLSATALELLYGFVEGHNAQSLKKTKFLLSGDFCQLPPIPPILAGRKRAEAIPFAFKSPIWDQVFQPALTSLTTNYRQSGDLKFQRALQLARRGDASATVAALECEYSTTVDMGFEGLSLYPINADVAAHNGRKLSEIQAPVITDRAVTWGEQPQREWKDLLEPVQLKIGAQVRITANDTPHFVYVNGDIGTLAEYEPGRRATVQLHRGDRQTVPVALVTRLNQRPLDIGELPPQVAWNGFQVPVSYSGAGKPLYDAYIIACQQAKHPYYDPKTRKWIIGAITYLPITLGWASTVHKAQGLTATALQIDIHNRFAGQPQMMYVALSRCR
jgi:hypothetical protein